VGQVGLTDRLVKLGGWGIGVGKGLVFFPG